VHDRVISPNAVYPSGFASKTKVEVEDGEDFPHIHAKETYAQYPFLNKVQVKSSQAVPTSGILTLVHILSLSLSLSLMYTNVFFLCFFSLLVG